MTAAQVPRPEGNTVDISVVFFSNFIFIVYWSRDNLHSGVCDTIFLSSVILIFSLFNALLLCLLHTLFAAQMFFSR